MVETRTRITAEELKQEMESDQPPVVINVLGRDAYRARHLPGSINIPTDEIDRVKQLVPFKGEPIVVHCANEDCDASPRAARRLSEMGYTNVRDFEAGYAGWKQAGYPFIGQEA